MKASVTPRAAGAPVPGTVILWAALPDVTGSLWVNPAPRARPTKKPHPGASLSGAGSATSQAGWRPEAVNHVTPPSHSDVASPLRKWASPRSEDDTQLSAAVALFRMRPRDEQSAMASSEILGLPAGVAAPLPLMFAHSGRPNHSIATLAIECFAQLDAVWH